MGEVVHTEVCRNCGHIMAVIRLDDSHDGGLTFDGTAVESWVLMLDRQKGDYRFFCPKCGSYQTWNSGDRHFVELTKLNSIEEVISSADEPKKWQFPQVAVPAIASLVAKDNPSPQLQSCAYSFCSNLAMVNATADGMLLAIGLSVSNLLARIHILGLFERERFLSGGRNMGDNKDSPRLKELVSSMKTRAQLKEPLLPELREKMRKKGAFILDSWANEHTELTLGIRAVLFGQITLAWTAFEALSADLWIAALNERPKPLATKFASAAKKGDKQEKSITFSSLAKYANHDFNLSKAMGSVFVAEKKADFTSLESTKFAYTKAFGRDIPTFDNDSLVLLELVRNVILHRGGIVDQKLLDAIKAKRLGDHPDCASFVIGKLIPADTEFTNRLLVAAANAGTELLEFVAEYLSP